MKRILELLDKMDKTKWMIVGLCGVLLLVIAVPTERGEKAKDAPKADKAAGQADAASLEAYRRRIEAQLSDTLRNVEGAGDVQVMLTFQDKGECVVEKDVARSEGSGMDASGGQYQENSLYDETDGKKPFVKRQELPRIEGVLVIAQGGGDSFVKNEITQAVAALFSLETHKIKVLKMKNR